MPQSSVWLRRAGRAAVLCVPVLLALHRSSDATLLGRYSLFYVLLLAGVTLVAVLIAFGNGAGRLLQLLARLGPSGALSKRELRLALAVVVLAHAALVGVILPPTDVFDRAPLTHIDYALHTHQLEVVVHAMRESGRTWAWDPFFCAGYPEGTLFDLDMKLAEVLGFGMSLLGIPLAIAFKLVVFLSFLAVPFILWWSAAALEWDHRTTLVAVIAGVLVWHGHNMLVAFTGSGMFSFVFAVYLAVLGWALAVRFLQRGGVLLWAGLAVVLSVTLMAHVTGVFLVAPLLLAAMIATRPSKARLTGLVAASLLAGAANLWWIVPVLRFYPLRLETAFWPAPPLRRLAVLLVRFQDRDVLFALLGGWGFWRVRRLMPVAAFTGLVALAAFAFLAKLSAPLPFLASLEPARFAIPMVLWAALGVAVATASLGATELKALRTSGTTVPLVLAVIALVGPILMPLGEPRAVFTAPDDSAQKALVAWLRSNTAPTDRIAFEDASPGELTGAWLRARLDREIIGGPFTQLNLLHSYASFTKERFFDRAIADLTEEDLEFRADQFALRFVVAHTPGTCSTLGSFRRKLALRAEFRIPNDPSQAGETRSPFAAYEKPRGGTICVHEVLDPTSLVAEGAGEVTASLDRITVRGATSGRTVLRYHWLPTLRTVPPLPIRERKLPRQPVGFIEVENGVVSNFAIVNGG